MKLNFNGIVNVCLCTCVKAGVIAIAGAFLCFILSLRVPLNTGKFSCVDTSAERKGHVGENMSASMHVRLLIRLSSCTGLV